MEHFCEAYANWPFLLANPPIIIPHDGRCGCIAHFTWKSKLTGIVYWVCAEHFDIITDKDAL